MTPVPVIGWFIGVPSSKLWWLIVWCVLCQIYCTIALFVNDICDSGLMLTPEFGMLPRPRIFRGWFHDTIAVSFLFFNPNLRFLTKVPSMINWRLFGMAFGVLELLNPLNAPLRKGCRRYTVVEVPSFADFLHTHDGRFQNQKYTDYVNMPLYVTVEIIDMSTPLRVVFPLRYRQRVSLQLVQELRSSDIVSPQYDPLIVKDRMAVRAARAADINITTDEALSVSDVRLNSLDLAYALYLKTRHEDRVKRSVFVTGGF